MKVKIIIFSVIGGMLVTLLTGLLVNTPPMLVGAVWYGYPFPWLIRLVLSPEYYPWRVNIPFLLADVAIWAVVIGIVLAVLSAKRT